MQKVINVLAVLSFWELQVSLATIWLRLLA